MSKVKCPKCELVNPEGRDTCARCTSPLPRVKIEMVAPSAPAAAPGQFAFRPGQVVASRYSVIDVIGRGGMGCIYRVRDNVLKEDVALKTLLPQFMRDATVVERFFNEARIARGLSHPNIVRVHDIGITGDIIYISMELVKGRSLREILESLAPGQRLPVSNVLRIIDGLCAALEYAHRLTVHRDIKPENVMVCEDGTVKLMDFGISKLMDTRHLTGPAIVMGTPFYMSPEQLKDSASVDARADIYSVGIVLYEILTGNMPTGMPRPASHLTQEVPPALDPIVAKCVDPDPANRYQNVRELRVALKPIRKLLDAATGVAPHVLRAPNPNASNQRKWARPALGAALSAVLVVLAGLGLYRAELGRKDALKANTVPAPAAKDAPTEFRREFNQWTTLVDHAKNSVGAGEMNDSMRAVFADADQLWKDAQTKADAQDPKALDSARQALQRYVALKIWPSGMQFVPPGDVTLRDDTDSSLVSLDGFFIDTYEVTNGQFLQFCRDNNWRFPPYDLETAPADYPVISVTFYDALAYAASLKKQLPTEAQWARAAYGGPGASDAAANSGGESPDAETLHPVGGFPDDKSWAGCFDLAGNVAEWTRSMFKPLPYDPKDGREDVRAFTFGTSIVVRGGDYRDAQHRPMNARVALPYQSPIDTLGFRCAMEIPGIPPR
jgi:formylglycine-generating enzyme required for sulfatase activity/tRNA A-37 threonylcarbamoyl transferase component Bud32